MEADAFWIPYLHLFIKLSIKRIRPDMKQITEVEKNRASEWFLSLRNDIVSAFEELEKSHFKGVVSFSVVISCGDGALDSFTKEVDHLSTSDYLAQSVCTGWRGEAETSSSKERSSA